MIYRLAAAIAVTTSLFLALPAFAQFVTPTSYTLTEGEGVDEGGSFNYFDDNSGTQLTDNTLGVDNWQDGGAYEWVGWRIADPTASFAFAAPVTITQVQIGFNKAEGAGIFLPGNVVINGQLFALTGTELVDNTRGFVNFDVNFSGTTLPLSIADGNVNRWIFVDEVRFVGTGVTVPEPSALALAIPALGMIGAVIVARRRKG